jgi:hypothetical protein
VIELGIVGAVIAVLVAVPAVLAVVPWEVTFTIGMSLVGLGIVIGVPSGLVYHARLWRALRPSGAGWWLHPTGLHRRLADGDRAGVLRWFYLGAVGFLISIAGCALIVVGALRS